MNKRHMIPLLTTFVLWGSLYIISKVALEYVPPVTLLALRYMVSIPALYFLLRLRKKLTPLYRKDMPIVLAIGFVGYFLSFCFQMLGIDRLSGSVSSLLGAMNPIFIPLLAAVFLKERITKEKVLCVLLSMVGVAIIVGVGGRADIPGALMMLLSVFLWSSASIIIRRIGGRYDPMQVAMMAMICALPFTGAWSLAELAQREIVFAPQAVLAVLYMGLMGTAAAHSLWNYSLSKMDASFCSMFYPLQPLTSALLGVLVLHESITINFVAGSVVICVGIVLAVRTGQRRA